ncbi:anti-sigma factor [Streptomyces sp. NPDC002328]|uniref:anti-sigma factor n=1 Tax=Streptomyces sp. NPDC002328 TaxID=3364642 RepID=UPI00368AD68A
MAELTEAAARLPLTGTETAAPPTGLLDRVLHEIDRTPQETGTHRLPGRRWRGRVPSWALAASLAAAAAFGGFAAWQYTRADDARAQATTLQSGQHALTHVLTAPDAAVHAGGLTGGVSAAVVVSHDENRAAFVATDLPTLDDGKVYELWFAAPSGRLSPAGLLPGAGGRPALVLERPLGKTIAVGITVEPAGGSARPTTEPLGIIPISP